MLQLKLKGLADHHLNPNAFTGNGGVNADYDALRHGPEAETGIPFHIGMQAANTPFRRHPPDFWVPAIAVPRRVDCF